MSEDEGDHRVLIEIQCSVYLERSVRDSTPRRSDVHHWLTTTWIVVPKLRTTYSLSEGRLQSTPVVGRICLIHTSVIHVPFSEAIVVPIVRIDTNPDHPNFCVEVVSHCILSTGRQVLRLSSIPSDYIEETFLNHHLSKNVVMSCVS